MQTETFLASFAHLEQRLKSCNSVRDDFNKLCVCVRMSCVHGVLDAPRAPLSLAAALCGSTFDLVI